VHDRGVARPGNRATVSLEDRRKERTGAIRRLGRRRLLIALGVLVLVAGAVWAVAFSPLTGLDTVTVTADSESEYVDLAVVEASADAQLGTPLVRLDVSAIESAAEALPGVADATVERSWPSGVDISVTPRVPVANAQAGDGWQLLDADGATIAEVGEPVAQLPVVDVPDSEDSERVLDAILAAIGQMPPELSSQVTSAAAQSPGAITFTLADGAAVLWGSAEESDLKSQVLLVLLEQAPASTYDVSVPRSPTTG
jgi:cell division protein FtsQ